MRDKFHFRVNVETKNQTGELVAVYFQIRKGRVARTREHADGDVFADYDRKGRLLGIEMLAPCEARVLDRIATHAPARKFVRDSTPHGMLVGAS